MFDQITSEKLKFYVYCLIDPRDEKPFYIGKGKENIVFVTHFVVISSMLNIGTSSGEIVITDKNLNIIGSIDTL